MSAPQHIVPRQNLDFGLDGDIPKYWFGGDVFKTRFFDAMSTIFPEGEKFFIYCVRDFKDQVTDPQLAQDIKDFIRQEAQHSMVHNQFNDRLKQQGIDVDMLERIQHKVQFDIIRKYERHLTYWESMPDRGQSHAINKGFERATGEPTAKTAG